jgi:sarcosine oxidase, subunit gamma
LTLEAIRRSPLEGRALPSSEAVRAVAAPFATRCLLRGGADVVEPVAAAFGLVPPTKPLTSASEGARAVFWLGPDEWLLLDEELGDWGDKLEAALAGVFHSLVDVSHRQTAIGISGPRSERTLSAGVPLDLDLSAFPVGMVTRTLLIKAEIVLWRRDPELFRLETGRSFAPYVAAVLKRSAEDQERS